MRPNLDSNARDGDLSTAKSSQNFAGFAMRHTPLSKAFDTSAIERGVAQSVGGSTTSPPPFFVAILMGLFHGGDPVQAQEAIGQT